MGNQSHILNFTIFLFLKHYAIRIIVCMGEYSTKDYSKNLPATMHITPDNTQNM